MSRYLNCRLSSSSKEIANWCREVPVSGGAVCGVCRMHCVGVCVSFAAVQQTGYLGLQCCPYSTIICPATWGKAVSPALIRRSSFGRGDAAFVRRPSAKIMPLHREHGLMLTTTTCADRMQFSYKTRSQNMLLSNPAPSQQPWMLA